MTKEIIDTFCPQNQQEWRAWLEANHNKEKAVWLIFHRKGSPKENLSWSEAVDEALCFGWIDSTKRTIDGEKYKQYFSPRKASSTWSKVNKDKIEVLAAQGLMSEAGLKCIAVAKQNGNWTLLDSVENLEIPEDMKKLFDKFPDAGAYFSSLSKSVRKMMLAWVAMAKRPETKAKRMAEIVENARMQRKPDRF